MASGGRHDWRRRAALSGILLALLVARPHVQQPPLPDAAQLAQWTLAVPAEADVDPPFRCGTPMDFAIQGLLAAPEALGDGEPLFFEQEPPLLRADHTGEVRFRDFQVVGDFPTVTFELLDPTQQTLEGEAVYKTETWLRTGTRSVGGRVISLFNPSWPNSVWDTFVTRRTIDNAQPQEFWGRYLVPGTGPAPPVLTADEDEEVPEVERRNVYVNTRSSGIAVSTVTKISDTVQYGSHVVNIWLPDFGDSRVADGPFDLNLELVTRKFYEHFTDDYDSIAVVAHANQVAEFGAFHRNVKNEIGGLGTDMPLFDNSAFYGSAGKLKSVEFYPYNTFGGNDTSNHEVNHQVADYWQWIPTDGVPVERKGHDPDAHTPMVTGGPAMTGAVLEANRVVQEPLPPEIPAVHGPTYEIGRAATPQTYHPTTLYRWGLIPDTAVPAMQIFENQGQFDPESSASPAPGTVVAGGHKGIHLNDLRGRNGSRTGPVYPHWWRVLVVVSRGGLLPQAEMDYWNFYGARHAATEGVRSYDGNPSFFEATRGKMPMKTDVTPKIAPKIIETPVVSFANLGTGDLRGVRFDAPMPGRFTVGEPVTVAGTITATDRTDFHAAGFRFRPYGGESLPTVFPFISGGRISQTFTFTPEQKGAYVLDYFLFWPDSGPQFPRGSSGIIYVD